MSKREELLRAAYASIAERGVRGLRVEDVAARARVAVSLVYYHFESRDGLLHATMEYVDAISASTTLVTDASDERPAYVRLEKGLLAELGPGQEVRDNCVVWHEIMATAVFDENLRAFVSVETTRWCGQVEALVEVGRRDGSVRADVNPRRAAEMLTTLLDGLILQWLSGSSERTRARRLLRDAIRTQLAPD